MNNSNPMDKITAHFRNKISGEMSSIYVEEWDLKIYYKNSNTLQEESKLIELAQKGKTVEALVETLIIKARNEDGTKMFKPVDRVVFLNEVDPSVLIKAVSDMNKMLDIGTLEDVEKN
jgi:hypothetical protein